MAKLSSMMLDMTKVESGKWVKHPCGASLCIASINSKAYKEARERAIRPHVREIRSGGLSFDEISEIIKPAVAEHILLGWRDLDDDDGNPIPYSAGKALSYFRDPRFAAMYRFVLEIAGEEEEYRQSYLEDSEKNSPSISDGPSSGEKTPSS